MPEKNNFVSDGFLEYIYVLDKNYTTKMIIDTFSDLLWTERYYGYGEFEITVPVSIPVVQGCRIDDYVCIRESKTYMIVETIGVHTDPERGDTLKISGRSLESILDRRIVWGSFKKIGTKTNPINLQTAIKEMLEAHVINPSNPKRKIPRFVFQESNDEAVTKLTKEAIESIGGNIYTEIVDLCKDQELGFRVLPHGDGGFEFKLYKGADRSWDQDKLPPVVFSDSYENLRNSDYLQSNKEYRSTVLLGGGDGVEDSEVFRREERVGLARRELYISDSSAKTNEAKIEKAKEVLADYKMIKMFEGETEPSRQFVYGEDYFLGDVVQLENKYGQKGKCRVTEIVCSRDDSGPSLVPTFEAVEEDDEEEKEESEGGK